MTEDPKDLVVKLVLVVFKVIPVLRVNKELRVIPEIAVHKVFKAMKALRVTQALRATPVTPELRATRVTRETPVLRVSKVFEDCREHQETPDPEVFKGLPETRVKKDPRVSLATGVPRATRVTLVIKDLVVALDQLARLVLLALVVFKVYKARPDQGVLKATKDLKVSRVLRVTPVHVGLQEIQDRGSVRIE